MREVEAILTAGGVARRTNAAFEAVREGLAALEASHRRCEALVIEACEHLADMSMPEATRARLEARVLAHGEDAAEIQRYRERWVEACRRQAELVRGRRELGIEGETQ